MVKVTRFKLVHDALILLICTFVIMYKCSKR
jgi:hypothetical protein